jgi:hypothetical protein
LATDEAVPAFWGVVKVSDFGGVPDHDGIERDNAMQGMLSQNAYLSCSTNRVFVGESAWLAMNHEWHHDTLYIPNSHGNTTSMYERTIRGLPLEPEEVKKLRTMYKDGKKRFTNQSRVEAYLLLWELYTIANRVMPQHHDSVMNYLLQPEGFDNPPPPYFPLQVMWNLPPLPWGNPVKQTAPLSGGELMNIDVLGLYLLRFH